MRSSDKFEYAIEKTLKHEGGLSDNKNDPGGITNYGISLRFLKANHIDLNHDGDCTSEDIKELTREDAKELYRSYFWDNYHYWMIDEKEVAAKVFDMAVNMGPFQAHKLVQRALNDLGERLSVDGILGRKSFSALNSHGVDSLPKIKDRAVNFYIKLSDSKPSLKQFLKGWTSRALS